jgi:hypothetical protein
VGAFRATEFIAHRYHDWSIDRESAGRAVEAGAAEVTNWLRQGDDARPWTEERCELQERMSRAGAHIRSLSEIRRVSSEAWLQWQRIHEHGLKFSGDREAVEAMKTRYLCFAHAVYLDAIAFTLQSGVGSRGSAIALDRQGLLVHSRLGEHWRILQENTSFREKVVETTAAADGETTHRWVDRRAIPQSDTWFEKAWARFREGEIYR